MVASCLFLLLSACCNKDARYYRNVGDTDPDADNLECNGGTWQGDCRIAEGWASIEDLSGCTTITGSLFVNDTGERADLTGLEELTDIGGSLSLECDDLESFTGLDNLERVGGELQVYFTQGPRDLEGLGSLTTVGGMFVFGDPESDPGSYSLRGLDSLTRIEGDLQIVVVFMPSLEGLEHIQHIGGALEPVNSHLESLRGLSSLTYLGGLKIGRSHQPSLEGLESLETIGSDLVLFSGELENISGLKNLITVSGDFIIGQSELQDLSALGRLESTSGDFRIISLSRLADLSGLGSYLVVGGDLEIDDNYTLTSLAGLDLDMRASDEPPVGGSLVITNNPSLPTCEAEALRDRLVASGWEGAVEIHGNDDAGTCE